MKIGSHDKAVDTSRLGGAVLIGACSCYGVTESGIAANKQQGAPTVNTRRASAIT